MDVMPSHPPFGEDLRELAVRSFHLALRHCEGCGEMHAVWPYIRLARGGSDEDKGSGQLAAILRDLALAGRRRILIAGAADTGLMAQAARACAGNDIEIVVSDRCEVPLALCRELAREWPIGLQTLQQDLTGLELADCCDIILMHGTLPFIADERRGDVLGRLRRALRP